MSRDALVGLFKFLDRTVPVHRVIVRGDEQPPATAAELGRRGRVVVIRRIVTPGPEHVEEQQIEQEHAVAERTYDESKER